MNITSFLSHAALGYHDSAIRKAGTLGAAVPGLISFAAGYPAPDLFPFDDLRAITNDLLSRHAGNAVQYGATRGYRPLIEYLVGREFVRRGINAGADEVIITTGSQQGLDLVGRVLIDPGDVVMVELPAYSGAIAAFQNLQADMVGVPQDAEGLDPEALERTVARLRADGRRVKFVYVTPNFQNPAGMLMSSGRRQALLALAERLGVLILEDDPYGTLYFEDRTTEADTRPIKAAAAAGRVIYLGTASKTLVPGFRVAWLVAPLEVAQKVELAKQAADLCSGSFDQRVVHAAFDRGVVDRLAPRLRAHYQEKRVAMESSLHARLGDELAWTSPRGGFFLWARLPAGVDDRVLFDCGLAHKVSLVIGSAFHVDGGGHDFARLSFSGVTLAQVDEGVERLAAALQGARAGRPTSG